MTTLAVIGDALLDRDLLGSAERLCPDAPVPVIDVRDSIDRPGGAALAACVARRLGADVRLVAPLADDSSAARLRQLLDERGVAVSACVTTGATVEKVRVRVDGQSLLRLDRGETGSIDARAGDLFAAIEGCDAVLVSDYGNGMTGVAAVRDALSFALAGRIPVVWDPHPRGAQPVRGTTIATPSRAEAVQFAGRRCDGLGDCIAAAQALRTTWRVGSVAVTLGARGAVVVSGPGAPLTVPVLQPVEGTDSCGAGDCFAAATALALGRGAVVSEAVEAGVGAATAFVEDGGAAGAVRERTPNPTASGPAAATSCTVVATSGCFDLLHSGHVRLLEQARRIGDRLVVLLNSDESVRRLKGSGRPLQPVRDRAAVLRSLSCVDEVVVFDDDTPVAALDRLRPAVFVKGGDYSASELPEAAAMARWNGTVITLPFLSGRSTTRLVELARQGQGGSDVG